MQIIQINDYDGESIGLFKHNLKQVVKTIKYCDEQAQKDPMYLETDENSDWQNAFLNFLENAGIKRVFIDETIQLS
jgi:hypothetical protein